MENRAPSRGRTVARRSRPLLLGAGVCTLALLAGLWLFAGRAGDDADVPTAQAGLPLTPVADTTAPPPTRDAPGAAIIVDESDTPAAVADAGTATAAATGSAADNPFAIAAEPGANAPATTPVAHGAGATAAKAVRADRARASAKAIPDARTRKPARSGGKADGDLLATLLKNIERSSAPPVANAESAPFSVLERPQNGGDRAGLRAAGTGAAVATARSAPSAKAAPASSTPAADAQRSRQIQTRLRQCPRANTHKGLQCRQKVCAKYAGQDPACPAPVKR